MSGVDRKDCRGVVGVVGRSWKLRFANFCDYNPLVEDLMSGKHLAELIYFFCKALCEQE